MTPTSFPEQNIIFNPPEGMEERCDPLPAFRGEGQVISCWRLTFWERIKLLFTGRLWFSVIGNAQYIVPLSETAGGEAPWQKRSPASRRS